MTRADINYIYQDTGSTPKVLYHYENGDQYPSGIREDFKVLDFINSDWSKEAFIKWIGDNYTETETVRATNGGDISIEFERKTKTPVRPKNKTHKIVDGYTDYGYVFDNLLGKRTVTVYNWGKEIFEGTDKEFAKWIKEQ